MGILLAFAPFIVFALIDRVAGPLAGLIAGALVSFILLARDWLFAHRSLKILDVGTALLFAGLVLYSLLARPAWSVIAVRLCVDSGLLLIVLASMVLGRPFTMQYAREQVRPELWSSPEFRRTNYIITSVWALAFALMVAAELTLLYTPGLPPRAGVIVIILALVGAVKFTGWYPEHVRTRTTS
jgi:predicted membrane-bound dolichyl-phosphate-mannose-protein mannosyltransferase